MSDSRDQLATVRAPAESRSRSYLDDDSLVWVVSEQPFSEYDRRSGTSLIFASELAVRRVRNYPTDWFSLSDHDLAALSWKV